MATAVFERADRSVRLTEQNYIFSENSPSERPVAYFVPERSHIPAVFDEHRILPLPRCDMLYNPSSADCEMIHHCASRIVAYRTPAATISQPCTMPVCSIALMTIARRGDRSRAQFTGDGYVGFRRVAQRQNRGESEQTHRQRECDAASVTARVVDDEATMGGPSAAEMPAEVEKTPSGAPRFVSRTTRSIRPASMRYAPSIDLVRRLKSSNSCGD